MPSDRVNEYLKSVCAEVRWRQAHDAVREELAAHIEDQTEAYMRSGMERETAVTVRSANLLLPPV